MSRIHNRAASLPARQIKSHSFVLHQHVRLKTAYPMGALADSSVDYEITRIMPREDDGLLFYRIKAAGRPERAVQEYEIVPLDHVTRRFGKA